MAPIGGQAAGIGKLTVKYGDEAAAVLTHADAVVPAISKSGDEAAAAIKTNCSFSADTPVATTAGAIAISALRLGDHVLGWDEATGTTGSYTVTAVLVHTDPTLVHLALDDELIETTPEHPFFTVERGWVAAGDLRVGEQVRQADGGFGRVQAVALEQRAQVMYNLTVAVAHTFFVGEDGWLVHNFCAKLHPNSAASTEANHVYEIRRTNIATGEVSTYKYGISSKPLNPDGTSPRALEQVEGSNAILSRSNNYDSRVLAYNVPGRNLALKMEQGLVDKYAARNPRGYYGPPGNKRPKPSPR